MASTSETRGRVKLDLSAFFNDYRQHSYILLKNSWTTVQDLKDYVEKTFEVADIVILTSDEVFLPLKEGLDIVVAEDELKVVTTSYVPSPKKKIIKADYAQNTSPISLDGSVNLMKSKRKRTHKRKIPNAEKMIHDVLAKVPPKVKKTDAATNVKQQHVYFDDECNVESDKVEFVDFTDSLDASKPRIIKARVIARELLDKHDDEKSKDAVEETCTAAILVS